VRFEFAKVNPELHLIAGPDAGVRPCLGGRHAVRQVDHGAAIGSGPYVVEGYDFGKRVSYLRNPHYWAKDHNTRRGMFNFERIVFKYYKDETVRHEAFKAGEFEISFRK